MSQAVDPKPPAGAITAVLVFAEAGDSGRALVAAAGALARDFDARLIGLGAQALHPMPASSPYGGVTTAHWVAEMTAQLETELAEAETTFAAAAQGLALEWRTAHDMPARAMAAHARSADLLVIRATAQRDYFRAVDPGELVLHAGRPVLLAPQSDAPLRGEAVVVGWKETRESRRALADALPLLRRARTVALTAVHGPGEGEASAAALEQVCAYLAGHGIAAEPSPIEAPDADVVDLLNARAQAIGADLIVTGAYGQSRLREWVFGGVTRRLMDEPRTWLFMSH